MIAHLLASILFLVLPLTSAFTVTAICHFDVLADIMQLFQSNAQDHSDVSELRKFFVFIRKILL